MMGLREERKLSGEEGKLGLARSRSRCGSAHGAARRDPLSLPKGVPSRGARGGGDLPHRGTAAQAGGLVSSPSGSGSVVNVGPAAPSLAREQSRLDEVERTAAPGRWTQRPESTPMLRPASSPPHVPSSGGRGTVSSSRSPISASRSATRWGRCGSGSWAHRKRLWLYR
jgi:hypothetical protein